MDRKELRRQELSVSIQRSRKPLTALKYSFFITLMFKPGCTSTLNSVENDQKTHSPVTSQRLTYRFHNIYIEFPNIALNGLNEWSSPRVEQHKIIIAFV